jgi:rhodanese-related sulfurtransferase
MTRRSVDELLADARRRLPRRVEPADLQAVVDGGGLVVDIRPAHQRERDGDLPFAVVIDRNTLEWRLDPSSPDCIPEVEGYDQEIVLVCHEGYASSLAAATLQELGLRRATDLTGGYQAYLVASGRPGGV